MINFLRKLLKPKYDTLNTIKIDAKKILANFDYKTRSLVALLDPRRVFKGKTHNLEIVVTDNRGNENKLITSFIW